MNFTVEPNRISLSDSEGKTLAELLFPPQGEDTVEVSRTFVDESLRGQGVAGKIMDALAAELRRTGRRALPTCSYAAAWFEKHSESADLLAP